MVVTHVLSFEYGSQFWYAKQNCFLFFGCSGILIFLKVDSIQSRDFYGHGHEFLGWFCVLKRPSTPDLFDLQIVGEGFFL